MAEYTSMRNVSALKADITAPPNPYVSGYGGRIPTRYWIAYGNAKRWHRVYVMCYSNAGTTYILHNGSLLILDLETDQFLYA